MMGTRLGPCEIVGRIGARMEVHAAWITGPPWRTQWPVRGS